MFLHPKYGFNTGKNGKPRKRATVNMVCHRTNEDTDKLELSEH